MRACPLRQTVLVGLLVLGSALGWNTAALHAADSWIEVKSEHFLVISNANDGTARNVAWQFEQIRSVIGATFPWAKLDLARPLTIIALKDESSMRAMAPRFWEEKGSVRPVSVWVSAPDSVYITLRADVREEDRIMVNPFAPSYFSYLSLIFRQSFGRELPPWFLRGLAGVVSNTIVRSDDTVVGAPFPSHLNELRNWSRFPLTKLVTIDSASPELRRDQLLGKFDAQSWAFVHMLMFENKGARSKTLNEYASLLEKGADPVLAFKEALGPFEPLENAFSIYISRNLFGMGQVKSDLRVKKEGFTVRELPPAEHAAVRASFHVAMDRPVEARRLIDEARKADDSAPGSDVAEAILLDSERKPDEARAAFNRAAEHGSTSAFAHYRLASLLWKPDPDRETLQQIEKALARSIALNNKYAPAYAFLAEVRASLNADPEVLGLAKRAISLEPAESSHHVTAGRVLWRLRQFDEARKEATVALSLAENDRERQRAQELLDGIARAAATAPRPAASAPTATGAAAVPPRGSDPNSLGVQCQAGDQASCRELLPLAHAACEAKNASACVNEGWLYDGGRGVAADPARAATLYQRACGGGEPQGCTSYALLQAQGRGVAKDLDAARKTLEAACATDQWDACTNLAAVLTSQPKPDVARAREVLARACDAKFTPACERLKQIPKDER